MKIVAIPDMHGSTTGLEKAAGDIAVADLVLLVGDITNFGGEEEATKMIESVREYNRNIFAVPGNCDYSGVNQFLEDEGIGLHGRGVVHNGVAFVGAGGSLVCPGNTPTEYSESDFQRFLEQAAAQVDENLPKIMVCHQPPANTKVDQVAPGRHVGSEAVRTFIEKEQPLICFSGHIHEGVGLDSIGKTKLVNPGPLRQGRYAYAEIGDEVKVLEIRGG